jgi:hypothetical protein
MTEEAKVAAISGAVAPARKHKLPRPRRSTGEKTLYRRARVPGAVMALIVPTVGQRQVTGLPETVILAQLTVYRSYCRMLRLYRRPA